MLLLEDDQQYVIVGFKAKPEFDVARMSTLLKKNLELKTHILHEIIGVINGFSQSNMMLLSEENQVGVTEQSNNAQEVIKIEETSMHANVCEYNEMLNQHTVQQTTPKKSSNLIKSEPEWNRSSTVSQPYIQDYSAVKKSNRQITAKTEEDILDLLFTEHADNLYKYETNDWKDNISVNTDGTEKQFDKKYDYSLTNLELEKHRKFQYKQKKRGRPKLMTSVERLDLQRQYHKFYNILFLKLRQEIDKNLIISNSEKQHLKAILSRDFTTHRKHNFKICNLHKYLNRPTLTDRDSRCKAIMCSILVKMFSDVEYWQERVAAEKLTKIEPDYLKKYASKVQDAISYYNLKKDAGLVSINDIGLWD